MNTLLTIALLAITPSSSEATLSTLAGPTFQGTLAAWDTQGIQLQIDGEAKYFPNEEILNLSWQGRENKSAKTHPHLELIDGSQISISTIEVSDHVATIGSESSTSKLEIPTQWIRVVQLLPEATGAKALWREIQKKQLAGDVLVVRKRKTLSPTDPGSNDTTIDYLTGVVGDLTDSQLTFRWDGETIPVKRSRVAAWAYYHAKRPAIPEPICKITTTRGNQLYVAEAVFGEQHVSITTPCGVRLKLPWKELVSADYSLDKLVYLSDLEPLSVQWTPKIGFPTAVRFIRTYGQPRFDRSLSGANLSLHWPHPTSSGRVVVKTYPKGLVLRSRTEIVYRVPAGMRHFRAIAGIDPNTGSQGNVDLKIVCDDIDAWEGPIDGGAQPVTLDLELRGATRLKIIVDYGKNLDWGDRLHLVEARVTK